MNIQFFENHWILTTLLLLLIAAWIGVEMVLRRQYTGLPVEMLIQQMNHARATCVDLREKSIYAQGHIVDALSLPVSLWPDAHKKLHAPRQRPIVLVCENGVASAKWCAFLRAEKFTEVYFLAGGMAAWRQENICSFVIWLWLNCKFNLVTRI